jgi:nicotinate-nucleotide adenylyltransferase
MSFGERLGILGGTLDPVHVGHVETALAARAALALDRVLLLPSRVPPHRTLQPSASPFHRFAMAALAVNGVEGVEASDVELSAPGPSYTASTLERFQTAGVRPWQIFFILGADAFAEIESWNRYPRVLDLANFVVVSRPGYDSRGIVESLPALAQRFASTASAAASGGTDTRIFVLPAVTPDVSSTEIRRRLRAFEPVVGLIGQAVERHIRQHRLYLDPHADGASTLIHSAADHLHGEN